MLIKNDALCRKFEFKMLTQLKILGASGPESWGNLVTMPLQPGRKRDNEIYYTFFIIT